MLGADHDKIILLSTPFPLILISATECCYRAMLFLYCVGNKRHCIQHKQLFSDRICQPTRRMRHISSSKFTALLLCPNYVFATNCEGQINKVNLCRTIQVTLLKNVKEVTSIGAYAQIRNNYTHFCAKLHGASRDHLVARCR